MVLKKNARHRQTHGKSVLQEIAGSRNGHQKQQEKKMASSTSDESTRNERKQNTPNNNKREEGTDAEDGDMQTRKQTPEEKRHA